jgi:hypothetical protein
MDGHLFTELGDVAERGLDRPFFLYGRQVIEQDKIVDHSPFTGVDPSLPADRWVNAIGTIDPEESINTQRTAILEFFQSTLS